MATKRKTITVTAQQDCWIKTQIASGAFTNDSEYIRDLIRRDQAEKAGLGAIRAALVEGEESGTSARTPDEIIEAVIEQRRKNGAL